jgi:uncharacterized protein (DUF58 family)
MNADYRQYLVAGEQAGLRYALAIPREAMHGAVGYQLGHGIGSSLDFRDYREYAPGDDLRRIDWGAYARSDKLVVKLYREEVNPHLDLVLDVSRSMAPAGSQKAEGCLGLAGLLVSAATNAACSHAAWAAGERLLPVLNGARRPGEWDALAFEAVTPVASVIAQEHTRWRRHGIRVLISDLLWEADPADVLRRLAQGAAGLTVIQLLARTEVDPELQGNTRLTDIEDGQEREVFVDAVARRRYREALLRHRQQWHDACRAVGATLVSLVAEDLLADGWQVSELERARVLVTS